MKSPCNDPHKTFRILKAVHFYSALCLNFNQPCNHNTVTSHRYKGVLNHWYCNSLFRLTSNSCLFRLTTKFTSNLHITGYFFYLFFFLGGGGGGAIVIGVFPSQRASNVESHVMMYHRLVQRSSCWWFDTPEGISTRASIEEANTPEA